ncbi:DUF2314 domain-containing protein [Chryseolinea sp. H1M3-3]|uniref:DUF2314 domain-containing protein n=1 Tax=Chryseolinea sp. H1M3-3 TaxID=3034144 RepID=UPI0023ED3910|nr:DUF2314 domain-containing protein [Chryseolinea sp. H1M3-3]
MKFTNLTILLTLLLFSCSTKNNQDQWDKENIRPLEVDDPRVERARKAAQDSLKYFVDYFGRYHGQENYSFHLKKVFTDKDDYEHMWSTPFSLYDNGFNCVLDNVPNTIKNYKLGDTVKVRFADIEDFIIVISDSTIIGHYLQKELGN